MWDVFLSVLQSISFLSATVFVNPFREMAAEESQKAEEDRQMVSGLGETNQLSFTN